MTPKGFWSYAQGDNKHLDGILSDLRDRVAGSYRGPAPLLAALRRDPDCESLVRISDTDAHLGDRSPALTRGRQHPEVELHYEARVFSVTG